MLHKGLGFIKILAILPDALICVTCTSVKPLPLICVVYAMFCRIYKSKGGGKGGKKRGLERAGKMQEEGGGGRERKGEEGKQEEG